MLKYFIMSLYDQYPRIESDRTHMTETSVLNQRFPVDTANPEISKYVSRELPELISTALLMNGALQDITTVVEEGSGVQLFPAMAAERYRHKPPTEQAIFERANRECRALTNGHTPLHAHIDGITEGGVLTHFRVAMITKDTSAAYTINGELGDSPEENSGSAAYHAVELSHVNTGNQTEMQSPIDALWTANALFSLLSAQKNPTEIAPDIRGRVHQLIEASPMRKIESAAKYITSSRLSDTPLTATLGHRAIVKDHMPATTDYTVTIAESAPLHTPRGPVQSKRQLQLVYNSKIDPTPYEARLAVTIHDPDELMPIASRDTNFDTISHYFRANPEEFFLTLGAIVSRLQFSNLD